MFDNVELMMPMFFFLLLLLLMLMLMLMMDFNRGQVHSVEICVPFFCA